MPNRGLLVAAALLALLAGGIFWSNREEAKKAGAPAADAPPKLLEIPEDQFVKIAIKRRDGSGAVVERLPAGWKLVSPQALPVDGLAVQSLVSALALVASERVIDEKPGDLMQYGFASPSLEIVISRKDGKQHKLLLGEDSPLGTSVYAQVAGDPRLYTLATATRGALYKVWQDLRDRRLLTFYDAKLRTVELNTLAFTKNGDRWAMSRPQPWRADNFAVEDLVRKLAEAKMEIVAEDEEQTFPAKFAGAAPYAIAKVTDDQGTQQLDVRRDKDGAFYARSSAVEGCFRLPAEADESLVKKAEAFRDRKHFEFGFAEPSRVEVKSGDSSWSFAKTGPEWKSAGKKIDPGSVQQIVDKLRELSATGFVTAGGGKPAAEYTITPAGKPAETVAITEAGGKLFATRPGDPTVYELDRKVVDELRQLAASAQALP
jgi:DNA-binding PadR family transcriptional regulator